MRAGQTVPVWVGSRAYEWAGWRAAIQVDVTGPPSAVSKADWWDCQRAVMLAERPAATTAGVTAVQSADSMVSYWADWSAVAKGVQRAGCLAVVTADCLVVLWDGATAGTWVAWWVPHSVEWLAASKVALKVVSKVEKWAASSAEAMVE